MYQREDLGQLFTNLRLFFVCFCFLPLHSKRYWIFSRFPVVLIWSVLQCHFLVPEPFYTICKRFSVCKILIASDFIINSFIDFALENENLLLCLLPQKGFTFISLSALALFWLLIFVLEFCVHVCSWWSWENQVKSFNVMSGHEHNLDFCFLRPGNFLMSPKYAGS